MALIATAPYATEAEYRSVIKKPDNGSSQDIQRSLLTCSRFLDRELARFFGQDGTNDAPAERAYELRDLYAPIDIDDLVSLASLTLDFDGDGVYERTLTASEYVLLPRNAPYGSEAWPYRQIQIRPQTSLATGSFRHIWYGYPPVLNGRGVWGWPAVPAGIVDAVIQLCALWRIESPRATTEVDAAGTTLGMSEEAVSIVAKVTAAYKRKWYVR